MKEQNSRAEEVKRRLLSVVQSIKSTMGSSLGPKGMDKMITQGNSTTITNDGSTILKMMKMRHPIAQLICDISHSQDKQSGDGTTSITLLLCALVEQAISLMQQKIHPIVIAESIDVAKEICKQTLTNASETIDGDENLRDCIRISLNSKIVNAYIDKITEVTMQAISHCIDTETNTLPLHNIRRVKIKGNMEEIEMVPGIVLTNPLKTKTKIAARKMKVAIFQCPIGQSKPNLDAKINVGNYEDMQAVIQEEKKHILKICKAIKDKEIDLIILQKSIIRESLSDLALHFLERMGILVIDGVDREEIELCVEQMKISPVVDLNSITDSMLGVFQVEELEGYIKISVEDKVCTVVLKGTDDVILDEVDRSFNDAINVGRLMVSTRRIIHGGGVPELLCYTALTNHSSPATSPKTLYCLQVLAKAFLVVPEMLAVNTGANSIQTVESLIKQHSQGPSTFGVSTKTASEGDMKKEHVVQPLGVSLSGILGAFDGASLLIRVDDLIPANK
ncbi:T-complex protein 1 subunit delta [Nematocida sp. AWRm80]|nr:T-complex protein 1 subunit delta [Nematocida sp. AWRm80]